MGETKGSPEYGRDAQLILSYREREIVVMHLDEVFGSPAGKELLLYNDTFYGSSESSAVIATRKVPEKPNEHSAYHGQIELSKSDFDSQKLVEIFSRPIGPSSSDYEGLELIAPLSEDDPILVIGSSGSEQFVDIDLGEDDKILISFGNHPAADGQETQRATEVASDFIKLFLHIIDVGEKSTYLDEDGQRQDIFPNAFCLRPLDEIHPTTPAISLKSFDEDMIRELEYGGYDLDESETLATLTGVSTPVLKRLKRTARKIRAKQELDKLEILWERKDKTSRGLVIYSDEESSSERVALAFARSVSDSHVRVDVRNLVGSNQAFTTETLLTSVFKTAVNKDGPVTLILSNIDSLYAGKPRKSKDARTQNINSIQSLIEASFDLREDLVIVATSTDSNRIPKRLRGSYFGQSFQLEPLNLEERIEHITAVVAGIVLRETIKAGESVFTDVENIDFKKIGSIMVGLSAKEIDEVLLAARVQTEKRKSTGGSEKQLIDWKIVKGLI